MFQTHFGFLNLRGSCIPVDSASNFLGSPGFIDPLIAPGPSSLVLGAGIPGPSRSCRRKPTARRGRIRMEWAQKGISRALFVITDIVTLLCVFPPIHVTDIMCLSIWRQRYLSNRWVQCIWVQKHWSSTGGCRWVQCRHQSTGRNQPFQC